MARYLITEYDGTTQRAQYTRQQRPAAWRFAYALWYDHLGNTAGRDTVRGWRGVEALRNWLRNGTTFEHGDKVSVADATCDYRLDVVRVA